MQHGLQDVVVVIFYVKQLVDVQVIALFDLDLILVHFPNRNLVYLCNHPLDLIDLHLGDLISERLFKKDIFEYLQILKTQIKP